MAGTAGTRATRGDDRPAGGSARQAVTRAVRQVLLLGWWALLLYGVAVDIELGLALASQPARPGDATPFVPALTLGAPYPLSLALLAGVALLLAGGIWATVDAVRERRTAEAVSTATARGELAADAASAGAVEVVGDAKEADVATVEAVPDGPTLDAAAEAPPLEPEDAATSSVPSADATISPRVFISHNSGDNDFGVALVDRLRAEGIDAWYDTHGGPDEHGTWQGSTPPATYWQQEIVRELTERSVFVVILSERAVASKWVQDEIALAWSEKNSADVTRGKVIVPVLRETCAIPPLVALVQYVDFRPEADQDKAWRNLLYAVRHGQTLPARNVLVGPPFDLGLLPPLERFIGRADAIEQVIRLLTASPAGEGQIASIAAANGLGGIGKTALATETVRQLMARNVFPDGIAVVVCRNLRDPMEVLKQALSRFLPDRREPEDDSVQALSDRARDLFRGKRALVVLDNVEQGWPVHQVIQPLRAAGTAVLVTSRAELPGVPREASVKLEVLPLAETLDVFAEYYGRGAALDLTRSEVEDATSIVKALGRHTLAVKLAAANAATLGRPLDKVAADLAEHPDRALLLENGEEAVRYVLASSYEALPEHAQRLFVGLAAFATADVGREAVLALAKALGDDNGERSLRQLVELRLTDTALIEGLPEPSDRERLRLHPLVRTYAEQVHADAPEEERDSAHAAIAAWYADYANDTPDLALTPDETNIIGALEWLQEHYADDAEAQVLIARICDGMRGFWRDTSRTRAGLRYLPWGMTAAERVAERTGERAHRLRAANIAGYYGDILQNVGRLSEAEQTFQRDLTLRREIADRQGEGVVLAQLGLIAQTREQWDAAERYFRECLALMRDVQDAPNEATISLILGTFLIERRDNRDEGCPLIMRAATIRYELDLPGLEEAVAEAIRLGCMSIEDLDRFGLEFSKGDEAGDTAEGG